MLAYSAITGIVAALKGTEALSLMGVLVALAPFAAVAALVVAGTYALYKVFEDFGGDLDVIKSGMKIWWEGFKGFFNLLKLGFYQVLDWIPGIDLSDQIEIVKGDIEENVKNARDNATFIKDRMAENVEDRKKGIKRDRDTDKKEQTIKNKELKSLESTNKALDNERKKSVDYNTADTVSLLGQELKAQNSGLAPKEQARKDMEAKGEEKEKIKNEKAKQEAGKKESAGKQPVSDESVATVADTSGRDQKSSNELLAALNTKLDALLRVSGAQLQVQRSLSADMFA
jgi:hypothetical protein